VALVVQKATLSAQLRAPHNPAFLYPTQSIVIFYKTVTESTILKKNQHSAHFQKAVYKRFFGLTVIPQKG
jgi:hypothetical protein